MYIVLKGKCWKITKAESVERLKQSNSLTARVLRPNLEHPLIEAPPGHPGTPLYPRPPEHRQQHLKGKVSD